MVGVNALDGLWLPLPSPGIARDFLFVNCFTDVRFGSFSTEMVKADVCTCPLRPESDRQPPRGRLTLRAKGDKAVSPRHVCFTPESGHSSARPSRHLAARLRVHALVNEAQRF